MSAVVLNYVVAPGQGRTKKESHENRDLRALISNLRIGKLWGRVHQKSPQIIPKLRPSMPSSTRFLSADKEMAGAENYSNVGMAVNYVQPRSTKNTSKIGIGTPMAQSKIQPIFPSSFLIISNLGLCNLRRVKF